MTATQKWEWYWKFVKPLSGCSANAIWSALTGTDAFGNEYILQDDSNAAANQNTQNVQNHKVKNFYNRLEINYWF